MQQLAEGQREVSAGSRGPVREISDSAPPPAPPEDAGGWPRERRGGPFWGEPGRAVGTGARRGGSNPCGSGANLRKYLGLPGLSFSACAMGLAISIAPPGWCVTRAISGKRCGAGKRRANPGLAAGEAGPEVVSSARLRGQLSGLGRFLTSSPRSGVQNSCLRKPGEVPGALPIMAVPASESDWLPGRGSAALAPVLVADGHFLVALWLSLWSETLPHGLAL